MNQAKKSVVESMNVNSKEYSVVQGFCQRHFKLNRTKLEPVKWLEVRRAIVKVNQDSYEEKRSIC